jgi:osmoprotectant transport system substrate-binding protein
MIQRGRTIFAGVVAVTLIGALAFIAGCGGDDNATGGGTGTTAEIPALTIANKGFTESNIVTEAYKQALEAKGASVNVKSLASSEIADAAIRKGDIQMYSEYTGTIVGALLKEAKPPTAVADQVALIKQKYEPEGLTVLEPAPFNNDNEVACTKEAVDKYSLTDLASLAKAAPNLVYSANPEHTTRADGLPLLEKSYGIKFKSVTKVDIGLRYKPIEDGQAQCVYAFGTDPQIAANDLVVITDNKGEFQGAAFQGIPVVSRKYLDSAPPEFAETVNAVSAALTSDEVRAMNAKVDIDKDDPEEVAKAFLESKGLLTK